MHFVYLSDDNVTTNLNCKFMSVSIYELLRDGFSYGRPAIHNELFVHKKEWEVRLLNEYVEDKLCTRTRQIEYCQCSLTKVVFRFIHAVCV